MLFMHKGAIKASIEISKEIKRYMSFGSLRNGATSHMRYEYLRKGRGMKTWNHMKSTREIAV